MPDTAPPRTPGRQLLIGGGVFTVLAGAVLASFLFQWPLRFPVIALMRAAAWAAAGAFCVPPVLLAGYPIARRLAPSEGTWNGWILFIVSWGAGGVVCMGAGVAALALGVYSVWIWRAGAAAAYLWLLVWAIRTRGRPLREGFRALRSPENDPCPPPALFSWRGFLIILGVMAAAHGVLPPDATDELSYHLVLPRLWALQGDWGVPSGNPHLFFPADLEVLWGYAMAVGGVGAARFITLIFALLTVGAMTQYMKEQGYSRWVRDFSLAFLLITPMMLAAAPIGFVEWPLLFFIFLGWWMAARSLGRGEKGAILVAALAWAAAPGMKYSAAPIVLVLAFEWLIRLFRRDRRRGLQAAALLLAAAGILAAPWYARNWRLAGDPAYPIGALAGFDASAGGRPPGPEASAIVDYSRLDGFWRWNAWLYHALAEPQADNRLHLLWPPLLLAALVWGWKFRDRLPWWGVAVGALTYFSFTPAARIYFPLLGLVWLFLPDLAARFSGDAGGRRWASGVLLAVALLSIPFTVHFWFMSRSRAAQDYLLGTIDRSMFLRREGLVSPAVEWIRDHTPPGARLWSWGEDKVFYLDRWVRPSSPYGVPEFLRLVQAGGAGELTRQIVSDRIGFVYRDLRRCPGDFSAVGKGSAALAVDPAVSRQTREWIDSHLEVMFQDERAVVYRVAAP